MKKYDEIYAFSTGEEGEEYGLYIMELNCVLHDGEFYLMYYFDGDKFIHRGENERKYFLPGSKIKSCKDEFGNQYTGDALKKRMLECIQAYIEEFPGYLEYYKETEY